MAESVLIVDDHAGFRAQARRLLEAEGYEVVDVCLAEGDNGFELAARLAELADPPAVVLTSSHEGAEFDKLADECGACGFVPKAELSRVLIERARP